MINKNFFKPTDISNNTTFKSVLAMITGNSELNTLTRDQLERYDLMIDEVKRDEFNPDELFGGVDLTFSFNKKPKK